MLAEAPTTTTAVVISSNGCPKCSIIKKSGELSCCARGGSWFKNCGFVTDSAFEHTWNEGIEVCKKGRLPRLFEPHDVFS